MKFKRSKRIWAFVLVAAMLLGATSFAIPAAENGNKAAAVTEGAPLSGEEALTYTDGAGQKKEIPVKDYKEELGAVTEESRPVLEAYKSQTGSTTAAAAPTEITVPADGQDGEAAGADQAAPADQAPPEDQTSPAASADQSTDPAASEDPAAPADPGTDQAAPAGTGEETTTDQAASEDPGANQPSDPVAPESKPGDNADEAENPQAGTGTDQATEGSAAADDKKAEEGASADSKDAGTAAANEDKKNDAAGGQEDAQAEENEQKAEDTDKKAEDADKKTEETDSKTTGKSAKRSLAARAGGDPTANFEHGALYDANGAMKADKYFASNVSLSVKYYNNEQELNPESDPSFHWGIGSKATLKFAMSFHQTDGRAIIKEGDMVKFTVFTSDITGKLDYSALTGSLTLKHNGVELGTGTSVWDESTGTLTYLIKFNKNIENMHEVAGTLKGEITFSSQEEGATIHFFVDGKSYGDIEWTDEKGSGVGEWHGVPSPGTDKIFESIRTEDGVTTARWNVNFMDLLNKEFDYFKSGSIPDFGNIILTDTLDKYQTYDPASITMNIPLLQKPPAGEESKYYALEYTRITLIHADAYLTHVTESKIKSDADREDHVRNTPKTWTIVKVKDDNGDTVERLVINFGAPGKNGFGETPKNTGWTDRLDGIIADLQSKIAGTTDVQEKELFNDTLAYYQNAKEKGVLYYYAWMLYLETKVDTGAANADEIGTIENAYTIEGSDKEHDGVVEGEGYWLATISGKATKGDVVILKGDAMYDLPKESTITANTDIGEEAALSVSFKVSEKGGDGKALKFEYKDGKYVLTESEGSELVTTDGKSGKLILSNLSANKTYVLSEFAGPEGYYTTDQTYEVTPNSDKVTYKLIKNHPRLVEMLKTKADGKSALAGAEFELRKVTAGKAGEPLKFTTRDIKADGKTTTYYVEDDAGSETLLSLTDGYVRILGLSAGTYRLEETASVAGYVVDKTNDNHIREFTLDQSYTAGTDIKPVTLDKMKNEEATGSLFLYKVDGGTGATVTGGAITPASAALSGVSFVVADQDGGVLHFTDLGGGAYSYDKDKGPKSVTKVITNNKGVVELTKLPEGMKGSVTEVNGPNGYYEIDTTNLTFTISGETPATLIVTNDPRSVELSKTGAQADGSEAKALAGVTFKLYSYKDDVDADDNKEVTGFTKTDIYGVKDGYVYDEKGTDKLVTNADGKIFITRLRPGSYYFLEEATLDDYQLSKERHPFTLDKSLTEGMKIIKVGPVQNELIGVDVVFTKKDSVTGAGIADAKFEILDAGDKVLSFIRDDKTGVYNLAKESQAGAVTGLITDADGRIRLSGFKLGFKGTIRETEAAEGYYASSGNNGRIKLEVKKNMAELTMDNDPRAVQLNKSGVKLGTTEKTRLSGVTFGLYSYTDDTDTGKLITTLRAVTDSQNKVSYVYDTNEKGGDGSLKTDKDGEIRVTGLPAGNYYFKELATLPGYELPVDKQTGEAMLYKFVLGEQLDETQKLNDMQKAGTVVILEADNDKVNGKIVLYKADGTYQADETEPAAGQDAGAGMPEGAGLENVGFQIQKDGSADPLSFIKNGAGDYTYVPDPKDDADVTDVVKTDANGRVQIDGFDNGMKGTITETSAKDGYYQKAEEVAFTVTATEGSKAYWSRLIWNYPRTVEMLKTGEDGRTPLAGAEFKLTKNGKASEDDKVLSFTKKDITAGGKTMTYYVPGAKGTKTLKSLSDGYVRIMGLAEGDYTLEETASAPGFVVDKKDKNHIRTFTLDKVAKTDPVQTVRLENMKNNKDTGVLYIYKTDKTKNASGKDGVITPADAGLAGAKFELKDAKGAVLHFTDKGKGSYVYDGNKQEDSVDFVLTNDAGVISITGLPDKTTGTITEIESPKGYYLTDGAPLAFTINYKVPYEVSVDNTPRLVQLTKTGPELLGTKNVRLADVTFGLYSYTDDTAGGKLVTTLRAATDEKTNKVSYVYDSGIKDGDGSLKTDKNGELRIAGLPKGNYYFKELSALPGYELPTDAKTGEAMLYKFVLGEKLEETQKSNDMQKAETVVTVEANNDKVNGKIVLYKADGTYQEDATKPSAGQDAGAGMPGGAGLENVGFQIRKEGSTDPLSFTRNGAGDYTYVPNPGEDADVTDEVKTDESGRVQIDGFDDGFKGTITETSAKDGYYQMTKEITFTVTATEGSEAYWSKLIWNYPRTVEMLKTKEDGDTPLAGAEFKLTKNGEDDKVLAFTKQDITTGGKTTTYYVPDAKGAETLKSSSDGYVRIMGLADGTYTLEETASAPGFIVDRTDNNHIRTFTLDKNSKDDPAQTVRLDKMKNDRDTGVLYIYKTDGTMDASVEDGMITPAEAGLAGAKFELKDANGDVLHFIDKGEGSYAYDSKNSEGSVTFVLTNDAGVIGITGLPDGMKGTITETESPEGYYRTDGKALTFTIDYQVPYGVRVDNTPHLVQLTKTGTELLGTKTVRLADVTFGLYSYTDDTAGGKLVTTLRAVTDEKTNKVSYKYDSGIQDGDGSLKTDKNGELRITGLPKGNYYFKELSALPGYELLIDDTGEAMLYKFVLGEDLDDTQKLNDMQEDEEVVTLEAKNDKVNGKIVLYKADGTYQADATKPSEGQDAGAVMPKGAALENVGFRIQKDGSTDPLSFIRNADGDYTYIQNPGEDADVTDEVKTDVNGRVQIDGFDDGFKGTITETSAKDGYYQMTKEIAFTVTATEGSEAYWSKLIWNYPRTVELLKTEEDGRTPLADASFKLTKKGGKGEDDKVLTFTKKDITTGGRTTTYYVPDAKGTKTLKSPSDGYVRIMGLADGTYTLEETASAPGFTVDKTDKNHIRTFTLDKKAKDDPAQTVRLDNMKNDRDTGVLYIYKTDGTMDASGADGVITPAEAGLAGARFEITDESGNVLHFTDKGKGRYVYDKNKGKDSVASVVTGDAGIISITGLPDGMKGTITETESPEGYYLTDGGPIAYTIDYQAPYEVSVDNTPRTVHLTKTGVELLGTETVGLADVTFALYGYTEDPYDKDDAKQIKTLRRTTSSKTGEVSYIYDKDVTDGNGKVVTDENGEIYFAGLPAGRYFFKEVTPRPGYELATEEVDGETRDVLYKFTLGETYSGSTPQQMRAMLSDSIQSETVELSAYNARVNGLAQIFKADTLFKPTIKDGAISPAGAAMADVQFQLFSSGDPNTPLSFTSSAAGRYTYVANPGGSNKALTTTVMTNKDGKILIDGFDHGFTGTIRELTPDGYYVPSSGTGFEVTAIAGSDDYWSQLIKNVPRTVTLRKVDGAATDTGLVADFALYSADGEEPLTFTGKNINGQIYYVYDRDSTLTDLTTGADGHLFATGLPPGEYYFKETAAPKGYLISKDTYAFKLDTKADEKEIVDLENITNTRDPGGPNNPNDPNNPDNPGNPNNPDDPTNPDGASPYRTTGASPSDGTSGGSSDGTNVTSGRTTGASVDSGDHIRIFAYILAGILAVAAAGGLVVYRVRKRRQKK